MRLFNEVILRQKYFKLPAWLLVVLVSFQSPVFPQNIPPTETAGAEQERYRLDEERQKQEKMLLKETEKTSEEQGEVLVPAAYSGPSFRMNDIKIVGNENISTEELQPIIGKLLNRDVNLSEINEVVSEIKKLYRSKGYIASYVYVPPQKVKEGVIELRIVEGKLGQVEVTGNKWFSGKVIGKRVQIEPGKMIEYQELTTRIARLNEHRDIKAKAVLKPGKVEGTTDVDVQVKDKLPIHLSTDVNNLGTESTGKTRWGISFVHTNLLGQMDQAAAKFQLGKGAWAVGSDYNIPINANDTRVGFGYQHSAVDLGGRFKALGIEGKADTYSPYLTHPFFQNDSLKASLQTGFDFKEVETTVYGQEVGRDSLRILNAGLNLNQNDRYGRTFFQNSFNFGFSSFLGASDKSETNATRPGTGGQFFIYKQNFLRYFGLWSGLGLAFRSSLQLSNDYLPPSEQFRLGGAYSVRGYPEGEYVADYGGTGSAELYVPTYFFPKDWKLPFSKMPLRQQIKGTTFFDFGVGQNRRTLTGERDSATLAGYGIGVRIHLFDKVFARAEWAKPIADNPRDNSESNFYFGVSAELF